MKIFSLEAFYVADTFYDFIESTLSNSTHHWQGYLDIEGGSEELVSAEEARGRVQLEGGLLLEATPPARQRPRPRGPRLLRLLLSEGLHLVQHRAEHLGLEAAHVQRGDRLAALAPQQRELWGQGVQRRGGRSHVLGAAHKAVVIPLCQSEEGREGL